MIGDCGRCPIPDLCPRRPDWCELAATRPRDSTEVRMIVDRSRMAAGLGPLRGEPARQPEYPEYPPLAQQAANLAGAFWSWAVSGFSMATEEEQTRRLAICESCEFFDAGPRRCRHLGCGCYLDAKTKLKTEHCPINKW